MLAHVPAFGVTRILARAAKKILANMTSKVTEKSHEWEWDGTGKDLFKKAKGTPDEIEQIKKKKQQWRMIK